MNWDDLKYLLAVARGGTFSAAATALAVNQTTVTRRIDGLTLAVGAPLFDRRDNRLIPTDLCHRLITHAERVEAEMADAARITSDHAQNPGGTVRLTTVEGLMTGLLASHLAAFRTGNPAIELELVTGDSNLSLTRREADIALRLARPDGGQALTRKLCDLGMALYAARSGARDTWLGYDESHGHLPEARWLESARGSEPLEIRSNSLRLLHQACADGLGRTILPCYSADQDPGLTRLETDPAVPVTRELWLLVHPTARASLAVSRVIDWINEVILAERKRLSG